MDPTHFNAALDSWHDFYIAVASASAALLGLLFVGVSINLSSITATERLDLRTRADLAFSNLLYLLGLSLIVLIPEFGPGSIAISFTSVAVLGLLRLARRSAALARHDGRRVKGSGQFDDWRGPLLPTSCCSSSPRSSRPRATPVGSS